MKMKIFLRLGILLFLASPCLAQTYELTCPAGSRAYDPLTTFNQTSQRYRQNVCIDVNGNITFPNGITNVIYTSQYAKGGVKFTYSATYTNASTVISVFSGDVSCNPNSVSSGGDVGKLVLLTRMSSQSNDSPIVQILAVPYNTTITGCSGNNFIISNTPTTSCTPVNTGPLCGFAYGAQVDDSGLDAAAVAAWGTPGQCNILVINDTYFFSRANSHFFNSTIAQLSSKCGGQFGGANVSGIDTTQAGPMLLGTGAAQPLIPYNFDFTTCQTLSGCMGTTVNLFADKIGVNGLGQPNGLNTPANNQVIWQTQGSTGGTGCTGSTLLNSDFANWTVNTNTIGVSLGGGSCADAVYFNNIVEMFGGISLKFNGSGNPGLGTQFIANIALGASIALIQISPGNGIINMSYNSFIAMSANGPVILFSDTVNGTVNSDHNNYSLPSSVLSSATIFSSNGSGVLNFFSDHDTMSLAAGNTGTSNAVSLVGSNTTFAFRNLKLTASGANNRAFNITAGNTIINQGGFNIISNGGLANNFSGTAIANEPYETQSGTCAANAATVTFKLSYINAPNVSVSVTTSGSTGAQATSTTTTTATIHCNGATDSFVATVYPNPV